MQTTENKPHAKNGRWAGYYRLLQARMKELIREPEVIFWVFIFPLLLAFGLGIAFRNKPEDKVAVAIVDGPRAQPVQQLLQNSAQGKSIHADILDEATANDKFRLGSYALVILPQDEGVQYRFDPSRPESVQARVQIDDALQSASGRKDVVKTSAVSSSEPGARYIDFLIPGLLGMNLMNSGMWGIGFALVEMRQRKLLKRFVATPMRRSDFLLGVMISRLVFMIPEVLVLVVFARVMFGVRVSGNVGASLVLILVGAFTFAGLGLLVAARAKTLETASGLMNLTMLPMWLLSGIFFSSDRFPQMVQPLIKALPLTPLIDGLRATMLEGAPLAGQTVNLAILGTWGLATFFLGLAFFRWN